MMKLFFVLPFLFFPVSAIYGQVCATPPVIIVPDTIYTCVGVTEIVLQVDVFNPGGIAGAPQYVLMAVGENNPIEPMTEWTNLLADENGQLYFTQDFSAATVGSYNFELKVRYSNEVDCESAPTAFSVTIEGDPSVLISHLGNTICAGGSIHLTAFSSGTDCALQWQERVNEQWRNLNGQTDTILNISKPVGGVYAFRVLARACVGGFLCDTASDTYEVTVLDDPVIMVRTPDLISCAGGTIPLIAEIVNGNQNCLFQWQEYFNGFWINLPGERNDILNIRKSEPGTYSFRVKVMACDAGDNCEATSDAFQLMVKADPTIQANTLRNLACVGGLIRMFASINNPNGDCQLQWQEWVNEEWLDLENATTDIISLTKEEPGKYTFRATVIDCSGGMGCAAVSDLVELIFVPDPMVSIIAEKEVTCIGGALQMDAIVSNGHGVCQIGWEEFIEGEWVVIEGEQSSSLLVSKTIAGAYRFRSTLVSCSVGEGCTATSDPLELVFTSDPVITISSDLNTACLEGNIRVEAHPALENGDCQLQWQELRGEEWVDLPNANRSVLFVKKNTAGTYFVRVIQRECGDEGDCDAISDPFQISFESDPQVQIRVEEVTACAGGILELSAILTDGRGACSLQWEELVGNNWVVIPDASGETLEVTKEAVGDYFYRVQIRTCTDLDGCNAVSPPVQVIFEDGPSVTVSVSDNSACAGGNLQLTANIEGGYGACQYQWQAFVADHWEDLPDANASTLRISQESVGSYSYRVKVTACEGNDGCRAISPTFDAVFVEDPILRISGPNKVCRAERVQLTAIVENNPGSCNLQWQELTNGVWKNITGQTAAILPLTREQNGLYTYRVQAIGCNSGSGCNANSEPFSVTVADGPAMRLLPTREAVCVGTIVSFTAMVQSGGGCEQVKYLIKRHGEGENFTEATIKDAGQAFNLPTDLPPSYILSSATYTIRAELFCPTGSCSNFAEATLTVRAKPAISESLSPSFCGEEAIGMVLTLQNPNEPGVLETSYKIVAVNAAGLTSLAGDPFSAIGIYANDRVISDDAWLNTSDAPVVVSYAIIPRFTYGENEFCEGQVRSVEVIIQPKPELQKADGASVCSGSPLGIPLTTQISGNQDRIYYRIKNIAANGLIAVSGVTQTSPERFNDANFIADDIWKNTGKMAVDVIYTIQPVLEDAVGSYCYGAEKELRISIKPAPVLNPGAPVTLCSAEQGLIENQQETGIILRIDNDPDIEGNQAPLYGEPDQSKLFFRLDAVEITGELLPGLGNARRGGIGGEDMLRSDTWANPGREPAEVIYWITPLVVDQQGGEEECICYGDSQQISVLVMPAPAVDIMLNITGVDYPGSGTCGNFDFFLEVEICNNGPVDIHHLDVQLDLDTLSNGIITGISQGPDYFRGLNLDEALNVDFDGDTDKKLFISQVAGLQAGECTGYRLQLEVAPDTMVIDTVSGAIFQASAVARGDWRALKTAGFDFDESSTCNTMTSRAEARLGECWQLSRHATASDTLHVSLDENCQVLLQAEDLLGGYHPTCGEERYPLGGFYRLAIVKPGEVREGPFTELVLDEEDFTDGSASILIEPVFGVCLPLKTALLLDIRTGPEFGAYDTLVTEVRLEKPAQKISGVISMLDRQFGGNDFSCLSSDMAIPNCTLPYQTVIFEVDQADFFIIELEIAEAQGLMALYQQNLNPTDLCANLLTQNVLFEADNPGGRLRLVAYLQPGILYELLVASTDCDAEMDAFSVYFHSEKNGKVIKTSSLANEVQSTLYYPLWCMDLDSILFKTSSTALIPGPPVLGDCMPTTVWFDDELFSNGECGGFRIRRTWRVRDGQDRLGPPIVQTIQFSRPGRGDIFKPAANLNFECDELSPGMLNSNGYPLPSVAGAPFIMSAFGTRLFDEEICNIGATYQEISDRQVCEDRQAIIREWMIIDSCGRGPQNQIRYDTLTTFQQVIQIGDFTAPQVMPLADVIVSTTDTGCSGILTIDNLVVSDFCSKNVRVTAKVYQERMEPILDEFGRETGAFSDALDLIYTGGIGDEVSGIALGFTYLVTYSVADACGNTAMPVSYEVRVEDDTAPMAICNNDLKIRLDTNGRGRLRADDVDGGSQDNCTLQSVWISRVLADESLRDTYLQQVHGVTFNQLQLGSQPDPSGQAPESWVLQSNPAERVLRRKDGQWFTDWREDQWFFCDDLGSKVPIELVAIDVFGHANVCSTEVTVEKQLAPYCVSPANADLTCLTLAASFNPEDDTQLEALFGTAGALDDCGATVGQLSKTIDWDCNSGTIERFFQAVDQQGQVSRNTCKQIIRVRPVHNYEIKFPMDASEECGLPDVNTVEVSEIGCDMLTINIVDKTIAAEGNACYGVERTFQVINWCEYDGESDPVVISRNSDCDGESGEEDVYVLVRIGGISYIDQDNNENGSPSVNLCGNGLQRHLDNSQLNPAITSTGYWEYTQVVQLFDRSAPVVSFSGEAVFCSREDDCMAGISLPFKITDACALGDVQIRATLLPDPATGWPTEIDLQETGNAALVSFQLLGAYPDYIISGRFPLGNHQLILEVSDDCQHTTQATLTFSVVDCKRPTPNCSSGLVVELMAVEGNADIDGDGDSDVAALELSASDFRISGLSDCSDPVTLSINRLGKIPDRSQTSLMLTCDDLDTVFVEIYAWDNANNPMAIQLDGSIGGSNYDRCLTYIVVKDDLFDLCQIGPALSGRIATRDADPVEYVEVNLTGQTTTDRITNRNGAYAFENLPLGGDFTISPLRNDDHRNGVNTFDLLMLNKHLLRTRPLQDPYQLIAADVNKSKTISTLDLIHMRRLLLTINLKFPSSESWRFIPRSYLFSNPTNPLAEAFPEVLNYNDVRTGITTADFVGLKVGDLNGSAQPNSDFAPPRALREVFTLQVQEEQLQAGRVYRIPVTADALVNIQGYQFTLDFDVRSLQLLDIEYGLAGEECFGLHNIEAGVITTSWIKDLAIVNSIQDFEAPLFTLVFRSLTDTKLSERLQITSRYTEAEAYNEVDEVLDVALEFRQENGLVNATGQSWRLYQNVPNPWNHTTQISFYLPEAGDVTLSIRDIQGRLLKQMQGLFTAGGHQLTLHEAELPASGVLYYTLETRGEVATRKMILID